MNEYYLPTRIYFGQGSLENLAGILKRRKRVCFFVGKHILTSGVLEDIKSFLSPHMEFQVFSDIKPNPNIGQVEEAVKFLRDYSPDLVVAMGGGSVIDVGKSAAMFLSNRGKLIRFLEGQKQLRERKIDFVAIPTTAGTGSEVTPWATVWGDDGRKYSLASPHMFPSVAICDPELTLSMPPYVTACTGMDALSQAIEAYWSIHSFPLSDIHAREAIRLVLNNLEGAVKEPKNMLYREGMMLGALEAGRAFSQTATTAVHSVSYPITARFGIPHGHACALTLAGFLEYNAGVTSRDCNDKRGPRFVKGKIKEISKLFGGNSIAGTCRKIRELMESIGLETSLRKSGVTNVEIIIEHGFITARVANNPRSVTEESLRELLEGI